MKLLVSIHDVTPAHGPALERLWTIARDRDVTPALLVVPDWHGAWPLEQHAPFVGRIRQWADAGAEIFVHGLRHDEAGSSRRLIDSLRALGKTAREGEFLTLDDRASRERVERALERLHGLGFAPIGFVPPAWLCRPGCHRVVAELGLEFSEDDSRVYLHRGNATLPAPAIRWSARTSARAWASVAVNELRWVTNANAGHVRIALHPTDLGSPVTARAVVRTLDRWLGRAPAISYGEIARAAS